MSAMHNRATGNIWESRGGRHIAIPNFFFAICNIFIEFDVNEFSLFILHKYKKERKRGWGTNILFLWGGALIVFRRP